MDYLSQDVQALFPIHLLVASSPKTSETIFNKYGCSIVSLLRLVPELNDLSGSLRDPSSTSAHQLSRVFIRLSSLSDLCSSSTLNGSREAITREQFLCISSFSHSLDANSPDDVNNSATSLTPWFQAWRRMFFDKFESCDHEFVGAYFGCLFVLSSEEIDNYKQIVSQLQSEINRLQIKFFFSTFLRYFIIVNLNESITCEEILSKTSCQELTSIYGTNSLFWLDLSPKDIIVTLEGEISAPATPQPDEHFPQFNMKDSLQNQSDPLSPVVEERPIPSPVAPKLNKLPNQVKELKPVVSQELIILIEKCLRQIVENGCIPWGEKQLKVLQDAISARKGIRKSLKQLLGIAPGTSVKGPTGYIYKLEADEMQQRKMADIAMSLGLTELAFKFYSLARDEFKVDGACLYFAGAAEMTGVTSFMLNRPQKHFFDQAVSTYLDVCKSYDLACRSTLLATDCLRETSPNDAAMFFIRMTSEDCDLRSALFLEQAARCFLDSSSPRERKASFHYVLAGHRFNKCSLRKHALKCYQQFRHEKWWAAIEHVNFTVARLLLQLSTSETDIITSNNLRESGVELLRKHSNKLLFFQDFIKEVKKSLEQETSAGKVLPANLVFEIPVPSVESVRKEPIEGSFLRHGRSTCFVRESILFHVKVHNSFQVALKDITLLSTKSDVTSSKVSTVLDEEGKTITFSLCPETVGEFDILGLQYSTNGVSCQNSFSPQIKKHLRFVAIESLPPIQVIIKIGNNAENVDAIEMMSGELCEMDIRLSLVNRSNWIPSRVNLITNAQIFVGSQEVSNNRKEIPLNWIGNNMFAIRAPLESKPHTMSFTIAYFDDSRRESRTVTRKVEVFVRECLVVEGLVEGVLSLRNTLAAPFSLTCQNESLELWPGLSAHILVSDSHIPWTFVSRKGFISIDTSLGKIK